MEKKTMDMLHAMICEEIEEIAKKGQIGTHENLDVLKDLLESDKNLAKIEHYQNEKEEKERERYMDRDMGYSQRKYYIDADYQPGMYGNSYVQGPRAMDGNSYGRSRVMYDNRMDDHSYRWYDPRYEGGYSKNAKEDAIKELQALMAEATDEKMKMAISDALMRMDKM